MPEGNKILWTERASADIEAIVRYIARRAPEAVGRVWPAAMGEADLTTPLESGD